MKPSVPVKPDFGPAMASGAGGRTPVRSFGRPPGVPRRPSSHAASGGPICRRNGYKDGRPDRHAGAEGGRPGLGDRRGGTEDAAAPAVTCKSRDSPGYAGQTPLTVRIQRACGQRLASGPLPRSGAGLLTEVSGR